MDSSENEISIKKVRRSTSKDSVTGKVKKPFLLKVFALIFFVLAVYFGVVYYRASNELKLLKNPEKQSAYLQKKIDSVIQEMSKYVLLNSNDKPVFAGIVEDPEALKKEQSFFNDASAGNYIFVFEKTQRALIWDSTNNKIVNFGVYNSPVESKKENINTSVGNKTTTSDKDKK